MQWLQKLFGGGDTKKAGAASAPTATLKKESANTYVLRVGGLMNKATVDRIQAIAAQDIERGARNLKVLIIFENFQGMRRGDEWGDVDFFARYEANIAKIALIGDLRREEEAKLFLGAGRRSGEVRCFAPGEEKQARAWLAS
jgi:hypothetical protein